MLKNILYYIDFFFWCMPLNALNILITLTFLITMNIKFAFYCDQWKLIITCGLHYKKTQLGTYTFQASLMFMNIFQNQNVFLIYGNVCNSLLFFHFLRNKIFKIKKFEFYLSNGSAQLDHARSVVGNVFNCWKITILNEEVSISAFPPFKT